MEVPEKDNANPTVLSVSELPARRKRKRPQYGNKIYAALLDPQDASSSPDTSDSEEYSDEPIDALEIYELIAPISDPEHPLSLESLGVVKLEDVYLTSPPTSLPTSTDHDSTSNNIHHPNATLALSKVRVELTPTVSHCSLATVIGLGVRVRLEQSLPPDFRVEVKIKAGTHSQAGEVNKQLGDKERVAAALENANLLNILKMMMKPCRDE